MNNVPARVCEPIDRSCGVVQLTTGLCQISDVASRHGIMRYWFDPTTQPACSKSCLAIFVELGRKFDDPHIPWLEDLDDPLLGKLSK